MISRRNLILGASMAGAATLAAARMPNIKLPRLPKGAIAPMVPKQVGSWRTATDHGVVLPPPDALSDRLYDNLVSTVYISDSHAPIMLVIAYNSTQDGVLQIHRPEFCYPAGGFTLSQTVGTQLVDPRGFAIPARTFTATSPERVEHVAYWTRMGSAFPQSWTEQKIAVMNANLRREVPDGMLARFSSLEPNRSDAMTTIAAFVRLFLAAAPERLSNLMIGPAAHDRASF